MNTTKKDDSHRRILASAGTLLRERGINGTSVSEVMDGAGMTVGGFYAHFRSKEALVAETLRSALRESRARLAAAAGMRTGAEWVRAVSRAYLSRAHRDAPETGCPLPATAGEAALAGQEVREALAGELDLMAEDLAEQLREAGTPASRSEALALIATMAGGLTLARATNGTALSDEILKACRDHIAKGLPE